MKKLPKVYYSFIFVFLVSVIITSCHNKKSTPFPENPSGFNAPVSKPFEFPEAKPLRWKKIPADSVPKGVTTSFDIKKLPSTPFSIHDFRPLKSPISSTPLEWDKLDEIKINLDTIKSKVVRVKRFMLPKPIITRHNPATKSESTTSGIVSLGQAEGLVGNQVSAMARDTLGSIWIGTERGLTKYNGDVFENYNFLSKGAEGNLELILDLTIDKEGNLWIVANISGLYKLNIKTEIVEHYQIGAGFLRIQEDHKGVIWLTNFNTGISFLDSNHRSIKRLALPIDKIDRPSTYGVLEDRKENLWIGYREKVAIINAERTSIKLIGRTDGLSINVPYEFTEDSKGKVWISSFASEANSISLAEGKIYALGAKQGFFGTIRDVVLDPLQRIWIMDNDTVFVFDPSSNKLKKIPTGAAVRSNGHPSKAIADLNGNVWMGTVNAGMLIVDSRGTFSEHFNVSNGLASNEVWGIAEDKEKRIWLATFRGVNIYDPVQERLYLLKLPESLNTNDHRRMDLLDEDHILLGSLGSFSIIDTKRNTITVYKSNPSTAIVFWGGFNDSDGNLWLSSGSGVMKFNQTKNEMSKIDQSSGLKSNTVWIIISDKKGKVWLATDKGVNVIDTKENTILSIDKKNGLSSDYASMILSTSNGKIIIGGDKGLSLIDPQSKSITSITAKEGLIPESMYDLTESKGRIYVGSENGLIIADLPKDISSGKAWRFTNLGKREGFPFNDYNQGVARPTIDGHIWLGAAPILTVIIQDPLIDSLAPKARITDFNIMDQNPSFLDLKYINSSMSVGDTLWNSDRSTYYLKDAFPEDSSYLSQGKITWDSLNPVNQMPVGLKLPHNQNSFNFSFGNLDIKGRDKIVYRYILDGNDEAWSEVSTKSVSKNFYNIRPGEYTFKAATRGFNGVWSKPATLNFTILPPWWQTWWAYLLYVIGFSGAVWLTTQYRSRWLKRENKVLEEKVSHRTEQLKKSIEELKGTQSQLVQSEKMASLGELTAGIAHEIQNPLNFVNNFSEVNTELIAEMKEELTKGNFEEAKQIAENISENEKKIIFHGRRADGIVKGMLQHSRNSNGKKEPTNINALADEYLRLAYHGLRAKDKSFNASMKTDFDENIGTIDIIGQDMGRVILNLITNAFYSVTERKNQEGGNYEPTVVVSTKRIVKAIEIRVSDNGNGIPQSILDKIYQPFFTTKPTGQGTGLGLSMSYDIVTNAHGGELKVETQQGVGTTFIIKLTE